MERSCPPSSTTTAAAARTSSSSSTTSSNNINNNTSNSSSGSNMDRNTGITTSNPVAIQSTLRQLNKSSYKISKHSGGGDAANPGHNRPQPPPLPVAAASPPPPPPPPPPSQQPQPPPPPPPPQPQPQPPVYNIHKNDFRDVVQKLTGSPAHHHPRAPSPPAPPKSALPPAAGCGAGSSSGTSSRLQKIRPPPLAQLTTRSPPALAPAADHKALPQTGGGEASGSAAWARALPLSPLPPFPAVSAAAESPITAYMRCLRSGGVSHQQALIPSPRGGASGGLLLPLAPPSPLAFGCVPTTYPGLLSPGLMFPPSPTPSPKWGDP